jgi:hypothetical protein
MLVIFVVKFEKWIFGIFSLHDGRSFTDAADDTLPLSSPRVQILHVRSG